MLKGDEELQIRLWHAVVRISGMLLSGLLKKSFFSVAEFDGLQGMLQEMWTPLFAIWGMGHRPEGRFYSFSFYWLKLFVVHFLENCDVVHIICEQKI